MIGVPRKQHGNIVEKCPFKKVWTFQRAGDKMAMLGSHMGPPVPLVFLPLSMLTPSGAAFFVALFNLLVTCW